MKRRKFIKLSCAHCIGTAFYATFVASLSSCSSSLPVVRAQNEQQQLKVPEASFNAGNMIIVRHKQLEYDVLLIKNSEQHYTALQMKCTHQDNSLVATKNGLFCTAHGSSFD